MLKLQVTVGRDGRIKTPPKTTRARARVVYNAHIPRGPRKARAWHLATLLDDIPAVAVSINSKH